MGFVSRSVQDSEPVALAMALIVADDGRRPVASAGSGSARDPELVRRLKELTALSNAQIGELLGVTRSNVQAWLRGQGIRRAHEEHLLQVLAVVEDAACRFGDAERTRRAMLRPVGPGRPRPFDYLRDRNYLVAGGFLQNVSGGVESFLGPDRSVPLTPLDRRLATLEDLSPTPRFELDEEFVP
jgi:predicted GNAT family acetyltransferase